jgi:hypothetical protein
VVGIVLGLRDATVRPWLQRTLLALALVGALDAAQTLATGIVTENRGQLWTWYVALLPAALLLVGRRRLHGGVTDGRGLPVHRVAVGLLAVLAVGGVLAWRADIGEHQATRQQYAALAAAATAPASDGTRPTVVVYQDPALRHTRSGKIMASTLRMAVRQDQDGVLPLWCTPSECRAIAAGARARRGVVDLGPVGGVPDVVGVVVPTPPSWI